MAHILIVDRYTDPQTGKGYVKGDRLPELSDADAERLANSIAEEGSVLAEVAQGTISKEVVAGAQNMSASQLQARADILSRLAEEKRDVENRLAGEGAPRGAFEHAQGDPTPINPAHAPSIAKGNTVAEQEHAMQYNYGVPNQESMAAAAGTLDSGDGGSSGPNATAAARTEARNRGVDLDSIEGTGDGGKVTKDDVVRHSEANA